MKRCHCCSASGCEPEDERVIFVPGNMLLPALFPGMKQSHSVAGFPIATSGLVIFVIVAPLARVRPVVQSGLASSGIGYDVFGRKGNGG
jgi:hypothetical protein